MNAAFETHASPVTTGDSAPVSANVPQPSRLWLWFVLAFVLQAVAWATWMTIASQHRVEEVPLETASVRD